MVKSIAFYLPQFHPVPENNVWWGRGFTEWHNVVRARKLFPKHRQPHLPADLGFYDLRLAETREAQAHLAREAGIDAFCYWHYWFGNGKRLLERPFDEVVASGNPDFPFCLAWANHSWYAKTWSKKGKDKLLIEQCYPGEKDYIDHFNALLPAFKDSRYVKIDNKPVFAVFKPLHVKDARLFIDTWNRLAQENGLSGIYFIGQGASSQVNEILSVGFNAVNHEKINEIHARQSWFKRLSLQFKIRVLRTPRIYDYREAMHAMIDDVDRYNNVYPTICPNYDHTPRSGRRGIVYTHANPGTFKTHVKEIFSLIKDKPDENQIVFIKSWNEWGEGNYMEPDMEFGDGYIKAYKECVGQFNDSCCK